MTTTPYADGAQQWFEAGFVPIPIVKGKGLVAYKGLTGYKGAAVDAEAVAAMVANNAGCNVALRADDVIILDLDDYAVTNKDGKVTRPAGEAARSLAKLVAEWGELPATVRTSARFGEGYDGVSGCRFYRLPEAYIGKQHDRGAWRLKAAGIDLVRQCHRQVMVWPSPHHSGGTYQALDERSGEVFDGVFKFADLPLLPEKWAEGLYVGKPTVREKKAGNPGKRVQAIKRFVGDDADADDWLTGGNSCGPVNKVKSAYVAEAADGRYDTMVRTQLRLLRLGEQGHGGVLDALTALRDWYRDEVDDGLRDWEGEWHRAWDGAITEIHAAGLTPKADRGCCKESMQSAVDRREPYYLANPADFNDDLKLMLGRGEFDDVFNMDGKPVLVAASGTKFYTPPTVEGVGGEEAQIKALDRGMLFTSLVDSRLWLYFEVTPEEGGPTMQVHTLCPPTAASVVQHVEPLVNLRRARAVVTTPLLRSDGSVLQERGYDEESQMLLVPQVTVPEIPATVTQEMARASLAALLTPLRHFDFVHQGDLANYIALMLTPAMVAMQGARPPWPLAIINAHQQGSGKGKLSGILRRLYGGSNMPPISSNEEEVRKQIGTVLTQTAGLVCIWDNVVKVSSHTLSYLLTEPDFSDRKLGAHESLHADNDRLWMLTGNNVHLGGDLHRRAVWVNIDPGVADPNLRKFDFDPVDEFIDRRGEMLAHVLTVIRGWVQAGSPVPAPTGGSYPRWQRTMTGLLEWLGVDGFMDAATDTGRVGGGEMEEWANFYAEIHQHFGDRGWTAKELFEAIGDRFSVTASPLREMLPSELAAEMHAMNPQRLGTWLDNRTGRFMGPAHRVFNTGAKRRKSVVWAIGVSPNLTTACCAPADDPEKWESGGTGGTSLGCSWVQTLLNQLTGEGLKGFPASERQDQSPQPPESPTSEQAGEAGGDEGTPITDEYLDALAARCDAGDKEAQAEMQAIASLLVADVLEPGTVTVLTTTDRIRALGQWPFDQRSPS